MIDAPPKELIKLYEAGTGKLREAVKGLSPADLLAKPIPGKWSTQTVILHLADAEAAFVDRIKRVLAMDNPALLMWSENDFEQRLHYDKQSVEDAILSFEAQRRNLTRILKETPESDFARVGQHNQRGPQTVSNVLGYAIWHLDHHLKFVAEKRKALGK